MQLPDVNVLINAFRPDAPNHERYRGWLEELIAGERRYAISDFVLSSVVRILTDGRIFERAESIESALEYAHFVRGQPLCVPLSPGPRHWQIFSRLCVEADVRGALVPDAYLAALAIEHGCEIVTADRDFERFPALRWQLF